MHCGVTADCNRNEVAEARAELRWQRNEHRYWAAIEAPTVRYKVDGEWTIDDAERLHRVLEIVLPCNYQVIQDTKYAYPDDSDTDLHLTGVESPVLEFANDVILSALTDRTFGEKQAQNKYDRMIGEWND